MENQYGAVNWGHYYMGGGPPVPWYHYPPPASFLQPGFQHRSCGFIVPQGYSLHQSYWNGNYQNCAWPDPSNGTIKEVAPPVPIKGEKLEKETCPLGPDSHDPLPMDISPCASPTLTSPTTWVTNISSSNLSSMSPKKCATNVSSTSLSDISPIKSPISRTDLMLKKDTLRASPKTSCVLKTVKFPSIDSSETSSSVLSLLTKCNACMKTLLAQAKGTNVTAEPCTCHTKQEVAPDFQSEPESTIVYEPPKTQAFVNDSLMKHKPKEVTVTRMAEEPPKRVVIQRVDGVARLFAVSDEIPLLQKSENIQTRKTVQLQESPFITKSNKGVYCDALAIKESCLEQWSSSTDDPLKSVLETEGNCIENVCPNEAISEYNTSLHTSTEPVSEHKNARAHCRRLRGKQKGDMKDQYFLKCVPPVLAGVSPCDLEEDMNASKDCLFLQSAALVSTDAVLSASTSCMQKAANSEVSHLAHRAQKCTDNSLRTFKSTEHSPTNQCSFSDISSHQMNCGQEVSQASVTVSDVCSSTCIDKLCTSDVVVGGKVTGVYTSGPVIERLFTSIEMKVDPKFGGRVEHIDVPLELLSQVEKLDEGWICSFE
nr:uncharacterized protein LOC126523005 [Dermacentor andersoni]